MNCKKSFILVISFLISTFVLYSEPLFTPDSPEVIDLATLYTKVGRTLPAQSFPVSRNNLLKWAELLKNSDLSDELEFRLDQLIDSLSIDNTGLSAELDWQCGYEHYLKTEDLLKGVTEYISEQPLGILGGSFVNYEYGGACLELLLKREYSDSTVNNFFVSKPSNPVALENQIVSKGYVYFGNDFLQLIIGRLPIHYGDPRFSSLMANKNLPYLDQVKMDMNIAGFKLEYFVASLDNREAGNDVNPSESFEFGQNSIWTMMHRLVYSFDSLRISLAEQAFISRNNNQIYIGDFLPLTVWHNAWLSNINISMFIDVGWTIFPGLELYFQQGFDDINASEVFGIADSTIPTIDAYILGVSYTNELYKLPYLLKIEIGHTHYLWGNFEADSSFEKAIYRLVSDTGNMTMPFSSPYGPGALWINLDTNFKTDIGISGGLVFNYLNKNTLADLITTPYESADEIMTSAVRKNLFEFGLEIYFNLFNLTDFYVQPSIFYQFDQPPDGEISDSMTWLECTLGVKLSGHQIFGGLND